MKQYTTKEILKLCPNLVSNSGIISRAKRLNIVPIKTNTGYMYNESDAQLILFNDHALKTRDEKIKAIEMHLKGFSVNEIQQAIPMNHPYIKEIINKYKDEGTLTIESKLNYMI